MLRTLCSPLRKLSDVSEGHVNSIVTVEEKTKKETSM
jgi:hypothetical protein